MNHKWKTLGVLVVLGSSSSYAQTVSWQQIGGYLKTACSTATGGFGLGGGVQFGGDPNLEYICTLSSMYDFVVNKLVNNDWKQFAVEVLGRYITDAVHGITADLGSAELNNWLNNAYTWMQQSYSDFRKSILNGMKDAIEAERDRKRDNAGLSFATPGGLADYYEQSNPFFATADTMTNIQESVSQIQDLDLAFRAKRIEMDASHAIESGTGDAISLTTKILGIPKVASGTAESIYNEAQTGLSMREIAVTGVKAQTEIMKQNAIYNTSMISQLSEIVRQTAMTNNQLVMQSGKMLDSQQKTEDAMKSYLESLAAQALAEHKSVADQVTNTTQYASGLMDTTNNAALDAIGDLAP